MKFKLRILLQYLTIKYLRRFKNRESLQKYQEKKIKKFLKFAVKNSKFYSIWFGNLKLHDYRKLPFLDKTVMMENFTALNTVGVNRENAFEIALRAESSRDFNPTLNGVTVGLSSGTSGNRGLFLVSDLERARHAGTILAKVLPRSIFHFYRVAFFMRANSNLYTASQSSRLDFQFYDLLIPLTKHFERLNTNSPDLLFAPPSMLLQIARAQIAGNIAIAPIKIFSIAETLDPLDEKFISNAFQQSIHQVYQCTEGFLGVSCHEGTLHLNEDILQIEPYWLNIEKTKFMPIITDFSRTTQPLIRYRLNDILTIKLSPCPCGSPLLAIECIEGRADDIIFFSPEVPVFPDFIRRAIIQAHPFIQEYWVRQKKGGELLISIRCEEDKRNEIEIGVRKELKSLADLLSAEAPTLSFTSEFIYHPEKKLRRVIREF